MFNSILEKNKKNIADKKLLISYENIFGEKYNQFNDYYSLKRLSEVFENCKIIITIRRQDQIIESMYRMYIENGGPLHIREYMYKLNGPTADIYKQFRVFDKFNYYNIVNLCQNTFGHTNIHVLPFELDKKIIIRKIEKILQVNETKINIQKTNSSLSYTGSSILRIINNFISTPYNSQILLRSYKPNLYNFFVKKIFFKIDRNFFVYIFNKNKFVNKKNNFFMQNLIHVFTLKIFKVINFKINYRQNILIKKSIFDEYKNSNKKLDKIINQDLKKYKYF